MWEMQTISNHWPEQPQHVAAHDSRAAWPFYPQFVLLKEGIQKR
jgi:hypothetical protein